ncbi:MAG: 2-oxo acid dehydrogenase subunit E2, partial [Nitriliruptorales bacterium]|nr:2-oxo acid dehydrogenase subunit E2 [Nitriliruptorales bacterium]
MAQVEVDVSLLLAAVARVQQEFLDQHGYELSLEVAVASAVAGVLVTHPELAGATFDLEQLANAGREHRGVDVGFVVSGGDGITTAVVPDAQYLTVAGLARRARAAIARVEHDESATSTMSMPTVIVSTDRAAPASGLTRGAGIGLLTVSSPIERQVATLDHLGNEVVRSDHHATLRLHHHDQTPPQSAAALLDALGEKLASGQLP